MVELLAQRDGEGVYAYLPQLAREYEFWMDGAGRLRPGDAIGASCASRTARILNRYWDDRETPREESYREDVETARASARPAREVYRNLRAGAESGWDFSSRWFEDGGSLATIRTVELLPIDLNSLLYHLEQTLARAYRSANDSAAARRISARAWQRRAAIQRLLWNAEAGAFEDYLWRDNRRAGRLTAATLYPLFFGLASREQADRVAATVRERLLQPNGLASLHGNVRPTVGCTQRLGTIAMGRRARSQRLRPLRPGTGDRAAVGQDQRRGVSRHWEAVREVRRDRRCGGRGRRIPDPGRLRLDQRRPAAAPRPLPAGAGRHQLLNATGHLDNGIRNPHTPWPSWSRSPLLTACSLRSGPMTRCGKHLRT